MRPLPLALAMVLAVAPAVRGQRAGRLEGDVTDSLHARPLAGATVLVMRLVPGATDLHTTLADDRGRFRFDSLAAGRYAVFVTHAILDSLELVLPPREVDIVDGERSRVALALPSGATLRARACPGVNLGAGRGAVVGQVNDADRERPLAGATVAFDWMDVSLDRTTMRTSLERRSASVQVDSSGMFRVCGAPTETFMLIQVQRAGRAGTAWRTSVPEATGLTVLRLSYSEEASRPLAAADDTTLADEALPPLVGTASLSGVVRTGRGQPLADAAVRVLDAAPVARTNAAGQFSLAALPAGTQVLEVRRVGYLLGQQRVELRSGRSSTVEVTLRRIVTLDSVRVLAQRNRYRQNTEQLRRLDGSGTYLKEEDIARFPADETSELLARMGLRAVGTGLATKLYVQRGLGSIIMGPCPMNIVIDGFQHQDANIVRPQEVGLMQVYRGPASAPPGYDSACGVVLIWTKR